MSQLESRAQIPAAPGIHLTAAQVPEEIRITGSVFKACSSRFSSRASTAFNPSPLRADWRCSIVVVIEHLQQGSHKPLMSDRPHWAPLVECESKSLSMAHSVPSGMP